MPSSSLQEIVCVLGANVAGNPCQFMVEKAFAQAGLDWRMLTCEVNGEDLAAALSGVRALGFRGCALAAPHLSAAVSQLDELSPTAQRAGAVNCVVHRDGKLIGENTVGRAFVAALRPQLDPLGKRCVLLGAGTTARAIALELAQHGIAELIVVNRTPERAAALVELLSGSSIVARHEPWPGDYAISAETDLLINATPLGTCDSLPRVPLDWSAARAGLLVADISDPPLDTPLLREAKAHAAIAFDSLNLLVEQVASHIQLWTAIDPDRNVLRDAVEEFLC